MSDIHAFGTPPPPPGSTRQPPPWEREGPLTARFIDTAREVTLTPVPFFKGLAREGGLGAPLLYAVIGLLVGAAASVVYQLFLPFGPMGMGGIRGTAGFGLGSLILLPAMGIVGLFIMSGLLHVLLMLIASSKQPFETTFRVMAYTMGTTSLANLVPIVGGMAGGIWGLILLVIGSSEAHEVPVGQAAIAVLVPVVLCCVLFALFWGVVAALIFGGVAAGLAS
jgi:hypothetical protein